MDRGVLQFVTSLAVEPHNGRDFAVFDFHDVLPIVVEVHVEIEIVEMLAQGEHEAREHENAARDAGDDDIVPALVYGCGRKARRYECHDGEGEGGGEEAREDSDTPTDARQYHAAQARAHIVEHIVRVRVT